MLLLLLAHSLVTVVDDFGWLHADGKFVLYTSRWNRLFRVNIDGSTRILAVVALNGVRALGFYLSISNGIISDASWKCTNNKPATNGR